MTTPLAALPTTQIMAAAGGGTVYLGTTASPTDANADMVYTPTGAGKYFVFDTSSTQPLVIRQIGGVVGTNELWVWHTGTDIDFNNKSGGNFSFGAKLTQVTDPTSAQDAATKAYVDAAVTTYSADETTLHLSGTQFSIISTYAGQSSIITVGTITTGVWHGTAIANANLANSSVTISGHSLSLGGTLNLTSSDVGLGSVTNDAQTKAAIVPNTAPSSGQVLVGNAGGTAYAPQTLSGSGATFTLSSAGVLTVSAIANASLAHSSITIAGTATSLGGTITLDTITGVSSNGYLKRTGANTLTNVAAPIPIADGGTNSTTALSGGRAMVSNAAATAIVESNAFSTGSDVLSGIAGGVPAFKTLTGTTGQITVTPGPSAITLALDTLAISALQGYVYGLNLAYLTSTTFSVASGNARDTANATTLVFSGPSTITITSGAAGAINGIDQVAIAGTVATSSSTKVVTGTSTAFLTAFGTRTCSGTTTGASTTQTGTGTKFLSEFAVGDLIGTNAKGYARITAIASDTSLTTSVAIPGGSPGGTTPVCIEQPWIQVNAQTIQQIDSITSDTSLSLPANSSATAASGGTLTKGVIPASQTYLMVWLGTGGSGTGVWISTQRTTPYGISGYATNVRRVGSVIWTGSAIVPFDQWGNGGERWYQLENGGANSVLSAGTSTSWTVVACNAWAPPGATALFMALGVTGSTNTTYFVYLRASGVGSATVQRPLLLDIAAGAAAAVQLPFWMACNHVQAVDYAVISPSSAYLYVCGYQESLL